MRVSMLASGQMRSAAGALGPHRAVGAARPAAALARAARATAAPRAARSLAAAAAPRADAAAPAAAAPAAAARAPGAAPARAAVFTGHPANNVTEHIYSHMGAGLHRRAGHPLCTLRDAIYAYFEAAAPGRFRAFDDLHPIVSTAANFDEVLVPADHVSRAPNDTYYVDAGTVLRCHTSAHQAELLRAGETAFLATGDVYRRDSIDATHYPVFHQMEGVRVFAPPEWQAAGAASGAAHAEAELKAALEGLARHLFGDVEMRWVDAYFPFTTPSFELEILFRGEWLEVLGCGVVEKQILKNAGRVPEDEAWAFGLGLERLAMVLFSIPDIRLFWTEDTRFLKQFKAGDLNARFKPFSRFPPCFKDVAFWLGEEEGAFTENNLCEVVRGVAGDLVEEVKLIDSFTHPKTGRTSNCFRVAYRSMERSLTDEEVNEMQGEVRRLAAERLGVELR